MKQCLPERWLAVAIALLAAGAAAAAEPAGTGPAARLVEQGLVVEWEAHGAAAPGTRLEAGAAARFRFFLHDETGAPLAGLDPAAWLAPRDPGEPASPELCRRKLRTYLGGSLFSRPALDLNAYQVLVLGDEPRLQALEPDFGFGMPRLLADLELPAPAFDWALDKDHRYVFLSLPEAGGVARMDTHSWAPSVLSGAWRRPERLALQPDGHYLWAAVAGGVMAFTTEPFAPAAFLATHPGQETPPTALEFSADGRLLFVAHPGSNRLAVVDTAQRELRAALELPGRPVSMAFSALARRLYLTLATEGSGELLAGPSGHERCMKTRGCPIVTPAKAGVQSYSGPLREEEDWIPAFAGMTIGQLPARVDRRGLEYFSEESGVKGGTPSTWVLPPLRPRRGGEVLVVDETPSLVGGFGVPPRPGLIRFAEDGRHGIVLHPEEGRISILDSARGRVVQTASLEGIPDQLAFSSELAYLRLSDRTELLMLPLAMLGREGEKIPTFDTVGGDRGFLDGFRPIPAAGIAQPPGVEGVLIANPGDHAVYFYKEGLAAPMGQLLLPKISPRAVLALDRSLREIEEKGTYETTLPLPAAGDYDLVFFLASPRLVHCFPLRIERPAPKEPK